MSRDPFQFSPRLRALPIAAAGLALAGLAGLMGVVAPGESRLSRQDRQAAILADYYRLEAALVAFVRDTGQLPGAAFDLTEGVDGGLCERTFVPSDVLPRWRGPYLHARPSHPTPASFWGVAEPRVLVDRDRDGDPDECCLRLHRGYGEIDDETAAWLDQVLDDGRPDAGRVRVTPTWIWFQVAEL